MVESESDPRVPTEGMVNKPDLAIKCGPLEAGASRVRDRLTASRPAHQNRHTIEPVEMTAPTIEKLNLALRGENSSYDELVLQEQTYAERFWRRAAGLN